MFDLSQLEGFEWDKGNIDKNRIKHEVYWRECEDVFDNLPLLLLPDKKHSKTEQRFHALGKTNHNRYLFMAFTVRYNKIRIISARAMSKKERKIYEQEKNHQEI